MVKVSVIIVNYNVKPFLQLCLQSVNKALKKVLGEIIVVDNASNDGSCQMVKEYFPEVILVENSINVGFSKANNQGVKHAKGKHILILNPDTIIPENTFVELFKFIENKEQFGAIGTALFDGTGSFLPESKRNIPYPIISLKKLLGFQKNYYAKHITQDQIGEIEVLVGAFMFLEKSTFEMVNGFDERYFMYGEDIDLSYSLLKQGLKNYYFPKIKIIHFKGESTIKDQNYFDNFYNAMQLFYDKFFKKNILSNVVIKRGIKFWKYYNTSKSNKFLSKPVVQNVLYIGNETKVFQAIKQLYKSNNCFIFNVFENRTTPKYDELIELEKIIKKQTICHLILDAYNNSFERLIFLMTQLQENIKNLTFEIRPIHLPFLIGSNDKRSNGSIKILDL